LIFKEVKRGLCGLRATLRARLAKLQPAASPAQAEPTGAALGDSAAARGVLQGLPI